MKSVQAWDPTMLRKFREEFGLSKSEMVRLLQKHGLETWNWATYDAWEQGVPDGRGRRLVTPRPGYQLLILRALEVIRRKLEAGQEARGKKGRK